MTGSHRPHARIVHLLGVAFAWFVNGLQEYGRSMYFSAEYIEAASARRTLNPADEHAATGRDHS